MALKRVRDSFLSAGAVGFARGLNETPKIAGLLLAASAFNVRRGIAVIAMAMALGGLLNARRVAETVRLLGLGIVTGKEFEAANIAVATLECHDLFPCRVLVGQELEPKYWFSKTSFKESYAENIWWPHLVDQAGAVGVEYGAQPMAFTVHAEWINGPLVVIVDKEGIARFGYYGTFRGDRPSIHELLKMVGSGQYSFAAPRRLNPPP